MMRSMAATTVTGCKHIYSNFFKDFIVWILMGRWIMWHDAASFMWWNAGIYLAKYKVPHPTNSNFNISMTT